VREQQKEITALREAKEQQIEDLRRMAEEAKMSTQNDLEKKVCIALDKFTPSKRVSKPCACLMGFCYVHHILK
jgi:hypothetical protein